MARHFPVVDCDGHLMESISELAEFMDAGLQDAVARPHRNRQGVFPSLDGLHYLRNEDHAGARQRERVTASQHRAGSGPDWAAFLDKAGIDHAVMFTRTTPRHLNP